MNQRLYLNDNWRFSPSYSEDMRKYPMTALQGEQVRLPHSVAETPFHYFDESVYQMVSCYQLLLYAQPEWVGKSLRLTFAGAAHYAKVYLNGELLAEHRCGYTAFTVDITNKLTESPNLLTVCLDSRENLNIPPFGHVIDYMTYGGLYRDVYLDIQDLCHITDVFPKISLLNDGVHMECDIYVSPNCKKEDFHTQQSICHLDGTVVAQLPMDHSCYHLHNIKLWSPDHPDLYLLRTELLIGKQVVDVREDRIGFRTIDFHADGLYVNGHRVQIRGLDRHQSYPYVGYAMPASMQRWDADLIKSELGLNAVRTSHYPQSHDFLDRCDELGILVFTEMPGWQHIGDQSWQDQAINNVQEMVRQYRNHPSIFLWGVRINESLDNDSFYLKTNALAHELDPTRPTSGVRFLQKSSFLEDVYAFNDFSYNGKTGGCLSKRSVTPDMDRGYLISEYSGHMFPSKSFDCEDHRTEHMLRHVQVLDSYYSHTDIAGGFGWCMFDYNTHKDFGSGDRICYHGVMDMFRNRKLAGILYAAQQDDYPVLEISSSMDIGEHPAGIIGTIYAITNADSVRLYKNGRFISEFRKEDSPWSHMPHGPIPINDFIGNCIVEDCGISYEANQAVKTILMAANQYGINTLPQKYNEMQDMCAEEYGISKDDILSLYNTYVGSWGESVTEYRFEAIKAGKVVTEVLKKPMNKVHLCLSTSHNLLHDMRTYDVAAIRIQALSDTGNLLSFYNEPIYLSVQGNISLIGPSVISLKGGMGGTYVKTTGRAGEGTLTASADGLEPLSVTFVIEAPQK